MITDKDREEAKIICSAIKIPIELSVGGLKIVTTVSTGEILAKMNSDTIAQILYSIRAESAEQARKEAAERAVAFVDNNYNAFGEWDNVAFDNLRAAILGDSATVSTDAEKLAIAVKALEEILYRHGFEPGVAADCCHIANTALKEIQG